MKTGDINQHKPMLTALKKAGFKVVELVKHGKKIVITVTRYEAGKRVF
jgi:tRNA U55 pseudouridine synthase TruB